MTPKQIAYQCRRNIDAAIKSLTKASCAWGDVDAYLEREIEDRIRDLEHLKEEVVEIAQEGI